MLSTLPLLLVLPLLLTLAGSSQARLQQQRCILPRVPVNPPTSDSLQQPQQQSDYARSMDTRTRIPADTPLELVQVLDLVQVLRGGRRVGNLLGSATRLGRSSLDLPRAIGLEVYFCTSYVMSGNTWSEVASNAADVCRIHWQPIVLVSYWPIMKATADLIKRYRTAFYTTFMNEDIVKEYWLRLLQIPRLAVPAVSEEVE